MTLGWPVPPRGGLLTAEFLAIGRARSEEKRLRLYRDTLPVNAVLVEAWADDD